MGGVLIWLNRSLKGVNNYHLLDLYTTMDYERES